VEKAKQLVDEVSEASRQQTHGIGQVSLAVTRVGSVTQTTAASAEESAAASEELSAQAAKVRAAVRTLESLVHRKDFEPAAPVRESAARRPQPSRSPAAKSQSDRRPHGEEFPLEAMEDGGFHSF